MDKTFLQFLLIAVIGLLYAAGQRPDAQTLSSCAASDPTGYFEGTAKSREAGDLSISLNLRCTNGRYDGDLLTPVGDFPLKDVTAESGQLRIQFNAGADTGTIEVSVDGANLRGSFRLA